MTDKLSQTFSRIRKETAGELRADPATRVIFSTDASIYQQAPLAVAFPKSMEDVRAILSICAEEEVPVLPRGAGSSLAGQTVGEALVLDFSRHMDQIEEINVEEQTAWVQPGVVLSTFNQVAAAHGLQFGPDPASADRATFGGIFGNNSTGAHSITYGMASDHVLEIDAVLADGSRRIFNSIPIKDLHSGSSQKGLYAEIVRAAGLIRDKYAENIQENWPKTWRNSSGYALNYLIPWSASKPPRWQGENYPLSDEKNLNLAPLLVGSEGTLAVFSRMKINLVRTSRSKVLAVLAYESIADAAKATPGILSLDPSAVELVPRAIIEKARTIPAYAARLSFLEGSPAAVLLVEFEGEDVRSLSAQVEKLDHKLLVLEDPVQQRQLWEVRKVGLGLLMYMVGDAKPIPFIEDVAVPVNRLSDFVEGFQKIVSDYGTRGDFYAHASAGCMHIRPVVNLKQAAGIEVMRGITADVVELTLAHGGALSGEHGDGQARAEWLERVYGNEILEAFSLLKKAADPEGILNPSKVVDPPRMDENLRYGQGYRTQTWTPVQDFSAVSGLAGAIEMCNGAGVCRQATGSMCPTFQASREELHSTRGRANLLRELISGRTIASDEAVDAVFESLSMCLACKGCKAECPSAVDIAKLKYEFMHEYYRTHSRSLGDYLFGFIGEAAYLGRIFRPAANLVLGSKVGKAILSRVGISAERSLPVIAPKQRIKTNKGSRVYQEREDVIFLSDPFTEYFSPELLLDVAKILELAGCRIHFLPVIGAGRTRLSKGYLPQVRSHARKVSAAISKIDPNGLMPIIGIEPSEISMLTDDLMNFLPDDELIRAASGRAYSLEEFLLRPGRDNLPRIEHLEVRVKSGQPILLHGHCHQKAQSLPQDGYPIGMAATVEVLSKLGADVEVIQSGCCGMAGAFGYEADHVEMSRQVAEYALMPAIRAKAEDCLVVAPGASCRAQIESLAGDEVLHPVTLIAQITS